MKKFLIKILIFSAPLIALAYPVDIYLSKHLQRSHDYPGEMEVWRDIYQGNIEADIAVYGSSRAWTHFDPRILEDSLGLQVYNLGIDGHNFRLQYLRHKEYLAHNRKPRFILMSVEAFTLEQRTDLYEKNQFLPFMLWNRNIRQFTSLYKGFSWGDYHLPLFRYLGNSKAINTALQWASLKNDYPPFRVRGYRGIEKKWSDDLSRAKAHRKSYEAAIDPETVRLFDQFLAECADADIQVILIYAPEYIDGQSFIQNREEVMDYFERAAQRGNLAFLDYSQNEINFEKEYFFNSTHLNKIGSQWFSAMLAHDLKTNPILIRPMN